MRIGDEAVIARWSEIASRAVQAAELAIRSDTLGAELLKRKTRGDSANARQRGIHAAIEGMNPGECRDLAQADMARADRIWWEMAQEGAERHLAVARGRAVRAGVHPDDLTQETLLGAYEAARRFDVSRGVSFNHYCKWWISRAQRLFAHRTRTPAKPPDSWKGPCWLAGRPEFVGMPLVEVARILGVEVETIVPSRPSSAVVYLDAPVAIDGQLSRVTVADQILFEDPTEDTEARIDLHGKLLALPANLRDAVVLFAQHGNLSDVASDLGISVPAATAMLVQAKMLLQDRPERKGGQQTERIAEFVADHPGATEPDIRVLLGCNRAQSQKAIRLAKEEGVVVELAGRTGPALFTGANLPRAKLEEVVSAVAAGATGERSVGLACELSRREASNYLDWAVKLGLIERTRYRGCRVLEAKEAA